MSNLSDFIKVRAIHWQYKDADFDAEPGGHYIVNTENNDVTMTLPQNITTSFIVTIKDAAENGTGFSNPNKFYVARHALSSITIMGDITPFDVDIPSQELSFVYNDNDNNVVI